MYITASLLVCIYKYTNHGETMIMNIAQALIFKIAEKKTTRLLVYRSNSHMYAQLIDSSANVIVAASTLEPNIRKEMVNGGNVKAAALVGKVVGEKATAAGVSSVAFDRSGYHYHGRVKALAEAARSAGLKF